MPGTDRSEDTGALAPSAVVGAVAAGFHDLANHLGVVSAYAELALRGVAKGNDPTADLQQVMTSSDAALAAVGRMRAVMAAVEAVTGQVPSGEADPPAPGAIRSTSRR